MPDVALLHHQYGPYHVARALSLERRLPGRVRFVQLASQQVDRLWQVRGPAPDIHTVAEGALEQMSETLVASRLLALLDELRPSAVVISGYAHGAMRSAARWCRRNRAASILLSDSHRVDRRRLPWKEWAKRAWVSRYFDAAFTAGALSAAYAQELGIRASRIWRGYDVVDNMFFEQGADAARARSTRFPAELELPDRVFLYVGRFNPEKNLHALLDAMVDYRACAGDRAWGLVLVGSGPQAAALEAQIRSMSRGSAALIGFKQIDELPQVYAAAAGLILPSLSEPWGLVVNEAMASGLPILASNRVGASLDLVFPGINGYIFDPECRRDMVEAMLRLSSDDVDREAMSVASRRIVANFTPDTWAAALADCIEVTLARRNAGR